MRNLILFGLLIILLLAAQFASAKTVDEVIEKYVRARGGLGRLSGIKSIYFEGTGTLPGGENEVIVKIIKEQDKLCRRQIGDGFILITETEGHRFLPAESPVVENIDPAELSSLQTDLDIAGPLVDYISKGHKPELLGKDIVEGNTCYKIKLTTNAGNEMMFWVDAGNYLLNQSMVKFVQSGNGTSIETFTIYRNYKAVDGIKFAHTCETKTAGINAVDPDGAINFYQIVLNPAAINNFITE